MIRNMPDGDEWKLTDYDKDSQFYKKTFEFDFCYISKDALREVFKRYIWGNYRTQNRTLSKLHGDLWRFKQFNQFVDDKGIEKLCDIDNRVVNDYIFYLRLKISKQTKKKLSYGYQKQCLVTLKAVIHWCQIHLPDKVPDNEIFTGNEYRGASSKLKIDFIPDDILEKINNALFTEENKYVKYGILILEMTGIRIGDMLLLKKGSIKAHPISGYTMEWFDHKSRKMRESMPVNSVFTDDLWDLTSLMEVSTTSDCNKKISFSYIQKEEMKHIVKLYAYYKLGKVKPQTVKTYVNGALPKFFEYCSEKEIHSFAELTRELLFKFSLWQREVKKNSPTTGYAVSHVLDDIIKAGQIMGWNVPAINVSVGLDAAALWEVKQDRTNKKVKPIPGEILTKILECAVNKETDIVTKAGIIIQSQTGLRINEVLFIRYGCVHASIEGCHYMNVLLGKTSGLA